MYAKQSVRQPNGNDSVGVEIYRGKYRLNLARKYSRQFFNKDQKRISTGLSPTKENLAAVELKAHKMHMDILGDNFDLTLVRYGLAEANDRSNQPSLAIVGSSEALSTQLNLATLWDRFCDYRKSQIAETTYLNVYRGTMLRLIKKLPTLELSNALEIRQWIVDNRSVNTAKVTLERLSLCLAWAVRNDLIIKNLFDGMAEEINDKKANINTPTDWDKEDLGDTRAFTTSEQDAIISAYESTTSIKHFAPLVKFLFLTGCRIGEASALRWGDVKPDCSMINFKRSYDGTAKVYTKTKIKQERKFPCGNKLQSLLLSIRPQDVDLDALIFTSKFGKALDSKTFYYVWAGKKCANMTGVIPRLLQEGKVSQYLKPYATRATFITRQINEGGNPIDIVAEWCGNSAVVIKAHYLDKRASELKPFDG